MNAQEILTKLVSFPVLGGHSNASIATWIEAYLLDHGVEFKNVSEEEGKRSIHCRIGPAVDGGIVLSGHTDVVPVEGQPWNTDPFVLTDGGDGLLYGRGSCDMKGFIACCLAVLPEMLAADLKRPIYFAFSYDEEVGCLAAPALAADIMNHYPEKPKYAIIGEPSLMQPVVGQKGMVIYETTVNGSAGHSSRIKTEVSAIFEASRMIMWLEAKMNRLIEAGNIDERFTPPHTSIHSGIFERSGIAPNVVSDEAKFYWDVRVIPMDKSKEILGEFKDYCAQLVEEKKKFFPEFKITTIENHSDVPPLDTPVDLEIVDLVKELSGINELDAVSYAAEAGQFAEAGFQSIICGPGDIAQAHRANEFISKEQLQLGVEMIQRLVKKWST